jgi:hypothetical protein
MCQFIPAAKNFVPFYHEEFGKIKGFQSLEIIGKEDPDQIRAYSKLSAWRNCIRSGQKRLVLKQAELHKIAGVVVHSDPLFLSKDLVKNPDR